jgi:hypothetical protein
VEHRWRCSGERRVERQRAARPRVPINCARRQTVSRSQNGGAGPFLVYGPAPLRVPARHVSGARWGLPGLRCTRAPGRRYPAVIGPTWTVAAGQTTTAPPARHSTRVGSALGPTVELSPVGAVPCRGGDTPPGSPLRFAARSVQAGDILVWPVILRHLGRGHGRFAGSPATWRLLSPRGWGVHPRRSARPPALWS